jgi:hypothetical protein
MLHRDRSVEESYCIANAIQLCDSGANERDDP